MEIKELSQSEFTKMLKSADNETYQTSFENDVWYERVSVGDEIYQHKLLSLKKMGPETLTKNALEAKPSVEPIRLRAQANGPVIALVFNTNSTVFYHLFKGTRSEMNLAKRLVIFFAKSLLPKTNQQPQETLTVS